MADHRRMVHTGSFVNDMCRTAVTSIQTSIRNTTSPHDLVFTHVPLPVARDLIVDLKVLSEERNLRVHYNSLSEVFWVRVMPTRIHNAHHRWLMYSQNEWLSAGLLTDAENDHLYPEVSSTVRFRFGPYAGSQKEPDYMIYPGTMEFPTLVAESGWSESWPRLMDDMNLWLVGGNGAVNVVILVKWEQVANSTSVRGHVELYSLDRNGIPVCLESEQVFPAPVNQQQQRISISRKDIFGPTVFPMRDPYQRFDLRLDKLRDGASMALAHMGLEPA